MVLMPGDDVLRKVSQEQSQFYQPLPSTLAVHFLNGTWLPAYNRQPLHRYYHIHIHIRSVVGSSFYGDENRRFI